MDNLNLITSEFVFSVSDVPLPAWNVKIFLLINKINSDMISLEKQISDVAEGLKDVVTKSELADMMNSFVSDDDEKWLMAYMKALQKLEQMESIVED